MSDSIYEDVIWTESERMNREGVEVMVEIYESVDHDFRTETNTQQPLQRTGNHTHFCDENITVCMCSVIYFHVCGVQEVIV